MAELAPGGGEVLTVSSVHFFLWGKPGVGGQSLVRCNFSMYISHPRPLPPHDSLVEAS